MSQASGKIGEKTQEVETKPETMPSALLYGIGFFYIFAVNRRGDFLVLFKGFNKITRIAEAQLITDLCHRKIALFQQLLGPFILRS